MELKRYVMLVNKEIVDTTEEIYYLKGENELYRDRPKACLVTVFIGRVVKTSDNILDLVEVGDLVNGSQCIYASEVTRIEDKEIYTSIWCHWKNEITTIWKKQPNGDYKRYEVK